MFDFHAELIAEPQTVAEFTDPGRQWCQDCPAKATTRVVCGVGVVDVVHDPSCPYLRRQSGGAR